MKKNEFLFISIKEKKNLDKLKNRLKKTINKLATKVETNIVINERHKKILENANKMIDEIIDSVKEKQFLEIVAFQLSGITSELGYLTGEITNENILENIFSKFCIGK